MCKLKNSIAIFLIFLFIICGFLLVAKFSYAAKLKSIDYMPRDQELNIAEKNYTTAYNLNESSCAELINLNTKIARCNDCMQLKAQCSDCCINSALPRKTKCQDLADPGLHPLSPIFQPISGHSDERKACQEVANCVPPSKTDPGSTDFSYTNFKNY